ncbi:MAG: DUF2959 domain-containing protein [Phycisphaerales bacterium JB063]
MKKLPLIVLLLCVAGPLPGCKTAYYKTMETFGVHKRDILVDRVEEARDKQENAKDQFASALEEFRGVVEFEEGSDLEDMYKKLNRAYERSQSSANTVKDKIDSVESVATALFKEWENELDEYSNDDLRRSSEQQLDDTKERYERMLAAMRRAEESMQPVLDALHDQVLFLKHNLNAQAIASIQGTAAGIQDDVTELIAEMERSITEANAFIEQMGGE